MHKKLTRIVFLSFVLLHCIFNCFSQEISYTFSFPDLVHHEVQIELVATHLKPGPIYIRMSRSSPGRYGTHEFGKNIYDVKAWDNNNHEVQLDRIDGDVFYVSQTDDYLKISYTLYANHPDGTYSGVDEEGVHLNLPSACLWFMGMDNNPITVKFKLPENSKWKIATQLKPTSDPNTFEAPGFQYLMDSPVKIGDIRFKDWNEKNKDGSLIHFRLAIETDSPDSLINIFAATLKRVTEEASAIFGEFPHYDFNEYTFLASYRPYMIGDGMEHRNSTMIMFPTKFNGNNDINVFAHELFHSWNVKRIRPKSLEPFDFTKSNMSGELWFAEGFTHYYGELIQERIGNISAEEYANWRLADYLNTILNTPGAQRFSAVENSRRAVFTDVGSGIKDETNNYPNMFTSYYQYGASIALALDMELRSRFSLSLDDYMHEVWLKFGKPEIPYTISGLQQVLGELTKDTDFARNFFAKYVYGNDKYDYRNALAQAGILIQKKYPGKAWIGNMNFTSKTNLKLPKTIINTPLYRAGLDENDQILRADFITIDSLSQLEEILAGHKPGDTIKLVYKHFDTVKTTEVVLEENPELSIDLFENVGLKVSEKELKFRSAWLECKYLPEKIINQ